MLKLRLIRHSVYKVVNNTFVKYLSTTSHQMVGFLWRERNGLPRNHTSRGVLTDGADYSFLDGRPTPYTTGQRERIIKQRQYAEKIIHLMDVIKLSKKQYQDQLRKKEEENRQILGRKLKFKGRNLSKKK